MNTSRKTYHKYPTHTSEPEKYLPSFFLEVSIDRQILKAEVRPLQKDKGYFTIILDGIFVGHIHKLGEEWLDFLGVNTEVYQLVGNLIEEHLKKTS
jgi:hypothetical protein